MSQFEAMSHESHGVCFCGPEHCDGGPDCEGECRDGLDEREAAWRKHVDSIAPYQRTGLIADIDAENRGRMYQAGFNAGWDARTVTVTDEMAESAMVAMLDWWVAEYPGWKYPDGDWNEWIESMRAALEAALGGNPNE